MELWQAIVYGIIQGLTEFFPVSSSAHLAVLPKFLSLQDPGVFFDLSMHVGTALAVVVLFRKDLKSLSLSLIEAAQTRKLNERSCFAFNLIIATVFSVVLVLALKPYYQVFRANPSWIAYNLSVFGLLLLACDYFPVREKSFAQLLIRDSVLIGIVQAFAIFPGVSRSGITITFARFFGHDLKDASRFSFLLSLPLIMGGFILKLREVNFTEQIQILPLAIGLIASFIVGVLAIKSFLLLINRKTLMGFFLYRVILSVILIMFLS